jgi:hypothetical protein
MLQAPQSIDSLFGFKCALDISKKKALLKRLVSRFEADLIEQRLGVLSY